MPSGCSRLTVVSEQPQDPEPWLFSTLLLLTLLFFLIIATLIMITITISIV